ncbi:MAG: hypothetical protein HC774_06500 [Sphingomonadales bacterium]|nr:hypothetical protein [Sphingomonadales bacterium]
MTEVSGRGVGLDAVKRSIERLGGVINVTTRAGAGTRFEIELSSMAALQRVIVVDEQHGMRVAHAASPERAVPAPPSKLRANARGEKSPGTSATMFWYMREPGMELIVS